MIAAPPNDCRIDFPTAEEQERLVPLRAAEWRGVLSPSQFAERNRRIFSHPYAQGRVETFVLRDGSGNILSSMDVVPVPLMANYGNSEAVRVEGILIASVVTAAADRGKGYASRLLSEFFESRKSASGVLYSDIGPSFYERYGFHARLAKCAEVPVIKGPWGPRSPFPLREIGASAFAAWLADRRREALVGLTGSGAAVFPDPRLLDWQIERYRYFAELSGRVFPSSLFWEGEHQGVTHCLGAVPDYFALRLDIFWVAAECQPCLAAAHFLASAEGLSKLRFWTSRDGQWPGKDECPMVRLGGVRAPIDFIDPQFCDWW